MIKNNGWYYVNGNNKAPSWTGVEFLYKFLLTNKGKGPIGIETTIDNLEIGDIIQLSFDGKKFSHSLIVVERGSSINDTLVATHSFDTFGKKVIKYKFNNYRCLHIESKYREITKRNKRSNRKMHKKGIKIILASGRSRKEAIDYQKEFNTSPYIISSNGSSCYDQEKKTRNI